MPTYFKCRFCKKRVCTTLGISTPALLRHMREHHSDILHEKYWNTPLHEVVKECFSIDKEGK